MNFRRRVAFAIATVLAAAVLSVATLAGVDLWLHKRAERSAGVNVWGYRGALVQRKGPHEVRVVVLGGSTVFGYGVHAGEAFPALMQDRLNRGAASRSFSVVNLGYNSEGAHAFRFTLEDYAWLKPDVVVLYEGYNDLMGDANGGNPAMFRHASFVFRATGYFPILPLVLNEKAMAMRAGGNLNAAYAADGKTVFQPTLATRATSGAFAAAAAISDSLERQFTRLAGEPLSAPAPASGAGCAFPWAIYCRDVAAAIDDALARGWRVVFVTQPYPVTAHARERLASQQRAAAAMIRQRYRGRAGVTCVDLGAAIDLRDRSLTFDGMHLTPEGNAQIADRLVESVRAVAVPQ